MPNNLEKAADIIMRQIEKTDAAFEKLLEDKDEISRPAYVKDFYVPIMVPLADALRKLEL